MKDTEHRELLEDIVLYKKSGFCPREKDVIRVGKHELSQYREYICPVCGAKNFVFKKIREETSHRFYSPGAPEEWALYHPNKKEEKE